MDLNAAAANSTQTEAPAQVPNDGTGIVQLDGYLEPFKDALKSRFSKAQQWIKAIDDTEGGLDKFSRVRPSNPPRLPLVHRSPPRRATSTSASPSGPMATSSTASGLPMHCELTSSATSTSGTAMPRPWPRTTLVSSK